MSKNKKLIDQLEILNLNAIRLNAGLIHFAKVQIFKMHSYLLNTDASILMEELSEVKKDRTFLTYLMLDPEYLGEIHSGIATLSDTLSDRLKDIDIISEISEQTEKYLNELSQSNNNLDSNVIIKHIENSIQALQDIQTVFEAAIQITEALDNEQNKPKTNPVKGH